MPIHEEEKKFQTRIYIIVPIFTPPKVSDWRMLGWRGCASKQTVLEVRNMASSRQLFWLVDLPLDVFVVFVYILSLGVCKPHHGIPSYSREKTTTKKSIIVGVPKIGFFKNKPRIRISRGFLMKKARGHKSHETISLTSLLWSM